MDMSDWTELDAVSRKIAHLEDRLAGARSTENHGLVELLDREIARAVTVRDRFLSQIAASITSPQNLGTQHLASESGTSEPTPPNSNIKGSCTMWTQLTHADVERVKRDFQDRHSEMLARHAEELKLLDADAAEVELLEQMIESLVQKSKISSAEIVPLGISFSRAS